MNRQRRNCVDNPQELTHLSLCAGYGGIDLGLQRALGTVRTIAFVEIEAFACANLVAKMEAGKLDAAPIWSNLKTFPWEQFRGKVDILSGGFPCQPFSLSSQTGAAKGSDDPRHLWPYIARGIRSLQPALVFLENVEGIFTSKLQGDHWSDPEGTPVAFHVLRELQRLGYKSTAGTFSAAEVGAPHLRRRAFFMALDKSINQTARKQLSTKIHGVLRERKSCTFNGQKWPAKRGEEQHSWEPKRTLPKSSLIKV
ncbi:MAG: hypothetical protein CL536_05310 [Alcaligenaceae bacterium]|nr:hypothetical protein [Alcaligenaceae bacterium]